jgi:hypothetical protein
VVRGPTTLEARPAIADLSSTTPQLYLFRLTAILRDASGQGISDKSIRFTSGETELCEPVTTDDGGMAECDLLWPPDPAILEVVLNNGYTVSFETDSDYVGSTADGSLVLPSLLPWL